MLIGGAMMFTFYKAMGKEVGTSLIEVRSFLFKIARDDAIHFRVNGES